MPYSDRMQRNHLYSVFFAPRGHARLYDLGLQIAQQYLSPFDKLIGVVGKAGSGKSMLIKGMFPGLELTNDDAGVNIRPLPLLSAVEDNVGFYSPHTYHVDIHFEAAFTQMHELASAIEEAVAIGKRVVVEHFDLIRPFMSMNAHLLIGVGEEIIITRPNAFGPEPAAIVKIVHKSLKYRFMSHTAEDLCVKYLHDHQESDFIHGDVRHGFILSFPHKPNIDLEALEQYVNDMIAKDVRICFKDDTHILIGDDAIRCSGPRMHVNSTGQIQNFSVLKELIQDPISKRFLLTGMVGDHISNQIGDINKIEPT
ncbi:MAG: alanine-tRNA synthetase second additional domain-containing protein [Oscillospiraceae bacterium]|nr:alanine-tRNA synthetase second additional domain-containing protein [Oscillospiraceae bacterium]